LLSPGFSGNARVQQAPAARPAAAAAAPVASYAELHRRLSWLNMYTTQTLAATFSKQELRFILGRHSITVPNSRKKQELAAELMGLIQSNGLSSPGDVAGEEMPGGSGNVARVDGAAGPAQTGLAPVSVAPVSAVDPDETQPPPGWQPPPLPDSRGGTAQPEAGREVRPALHDDAGLRSARTIQDESQTQRQSLTQRQSQVSDEPGTGHPMAFDAGGDAVMERGQPAVARTLEAAPAATYIELCQAEQDLVARLKTDGARRVLWPNFDALYLDLSVLPRLKSPPHPQGDEPAGYAAAASAVPIRASTPAAASTVLIWASTPATPAAGSAAAVPRRVVMAGDGRNNGAGVCQTPPAPQKKRPRCQGAADGAAMPPPDPDELSELVLKAQRLVRGVNEQQATSALASSNYNFSRALSALRNWSSTQARRGASGSAHTSVSRCPPVTDADSPPRRPLQSMPASFQGSLDLHNCSAATSSDAGESLASQAGAGGDDGLRTAQPSFAAAAAMPALYPSYAARGCVRDDMSDSEETEWDYGPDGDILPPRHGRA
jgi:type IV secretory pathway VirB10-like protein